MRTALNVIWFVLAGFWLAVAYAFAGMMSIVGIVTIPMALPSFKLAGYALWPFGRVVVKRENADATLSLIGNVIWFVFAAWYLLIFHLVTALVLAVTVIGIPLAVGNLKMARLALAPFGHQVVDRHIASSQPAIDFDIK